MSNDDILHFFNVKIRSVLEYAAPVFTSMLTVENTTDIERIHKIALKVILNDSYSTYESACSTMETVTLTERRKHLSLTFALKCLQSKTHSHFFTQRKSTFYKLRKIKAFEDPLCHTERYKSSPIPYLTSLLNEYYSTRIGSYWILVPIYLYYLMDVNYRYVTYLITDNKRIWFDLIWIQW